MFLLKVKYMGYPAFCKKNKNDFSIFSFKIV